MSEVCQHRRIGFGSGDYYIMCRDCPKWWVLTDPRKSDVAWPDGAATSNPDDIDVADRDRLAARVKELEETVRQLQSAFAKQAAREWSGAGRCNWLTR